MASSTNMGVMIGMLIEPHHDEGHSLMIHGVKTFEAVLGKPSEWDKRSVAFINDVIDGQVQTVEVLLEMFNRTGNTVPNMVANASQAWTSHPNVELLPVVDNAEPGSMSTIT
jgi:hypothetical protein